MIHQIYGCFRDSKPMPALFLDSQRRWQQVAVGMGAVYHLWNADEVDTLVRTHYGFLWDTYVNVRYPVMRVDMARVAILHRYGGLYSDLDVVPNRFEYQQQPFAVQMCPPKRKRDTSFLDMEVLVAKANHPLLVPWLEYMQTEIASRPYSLGFWQTAKMRYIWNTTGPVAMNRFLRLPANTAWFKDVSYLQSNAFWQREGATAADLQRYDIVTSVSNTYFTKEHSVSVGVSSDDVPLPRRAAPRRLQRKHLPATAPSQLPATAPSQLPATAPGQQQPGAKTRKGWSHAPTRRLRAKSSEERPLLERVLALSQRSAAAQAEASQAIEQRDAAIKEKLAAIDEKNAAIEDYDV